jgi:hypothetical protein
LPLFVALAVLALSDVTLLVQLPKKNRDRTRLAPFPQKQPPQQGVALTSAMLVEES